MVTLRGKGKAILLWLLILPLLYGVHLSNPTMSHEIAEFFSVVVALAIFMFTWNARRFLDNHYYLFLGIAFLFVGLLDFFHAISYQGMFGEHENNLPAQLWYAARYVQAISLLIAPLFAVRKLRNGYVIGAYSLVTLLLLGAIFSWRIFPAAYIEGVGVTGFKTFSDYFVSVLLLASVIAMYRVRDHFDRDVLTLLFGSVFFAIGSEMAFPLYMDVYSYNNLVGHYLKIVSFYLLYKAVIATGLFRPYHLLFRNLKKSEEEASAARDELESRVAERTAELRAANLRLEGELSERQRAEEMRQLILDLLQLTQSVPNIPEFLSSLTSFLKERIGCEAVGIRYRIGDDYPYFATRGFPEEFVQAEMSLCPADRGLRGEGTEGNDPSCECTCGAVIEGRFDPSLPFFTPNGTFWTNCASELLATSEAIKTIATRGRCVREGYESIALVPLRIDDQKLGLLQFNDRRRGMFPPHILDRLEQVAENIAGALARLLARDALRESEGRFRSLVNRSSVGILIIQDGRIVFRNPRQEQLFGPIPEGLPFRELGQIHPEDAPDFERLCGATDDPGAIGQDAVVRFFLPEGDTGCGAMHWFQCQAQPVTFRRRPSLLVDMVDITRVKDLERIATAREKLAAIGQLAAGIAHQIRNPLSGININVSTLDVISRRAEGLDRKEKEDIRAVVAQVKAASEKISSVIKRILEFSKSVPPQGDWIDINQVVRHALAVSEIAEQKSFIEFREHLSPEPLYGNADPGLLEQVLRNLVTNAIQAMDTVDRPGRITVITGREGDRAVLRVADTGPGVPEHLRERIFEPFYTTRNDGHGIGLSFCRRIVAGYGGRLSVGAAEGGGAEFRVELPLKAERSPV
jgi:PAS domain S-box-containing protein